ncbi:asparagine--tRNA ligase cytoplasmic 1 [Phtheirospermum japonicum]|uniref:asparagine--tRNA ligase n=1 Tax=Phtheirospermum japonicum TaxID=374723 RepID=A0A830DEZ1_9LAMI|nr:asparagine--tRNA ligase cytoplasmic 1 [Phtheirospermum japonicum]
MVLIEEDEFSFCVPIRAILSRSDKGAGLSGQKVRIGGWVRSGREAEKGRFAFLQVNDGSGPWSLQVKVKAELYKLRDVIATGTSIHVAGLLQLPPEGSEQSIELEVDEVIDVGTVNAAKYPLPKGKHQLPLESVRDCVHLRQRTKIISSIARIRSALTIATHTFFQKNGFLNVPTPIITTSDCEGAGEMFQVTTLLSDAERLERVRVDGGIPKKEGKVDYAQDFFARKAYLTVSGQLQVETYACAVKKAYTFGPTFRAENSHTSRHLAEFWMVEPEMAFADIKIVMKCAEKYVKFLCDWLLKNCYDDMEVMVDKVDPTAIQRLKKVVDSKFHNVTYTEAIEILEEASKVKKFENKVEWGIDLASEHERYLTDEKFEGPVIVYNYPKAIKAFYMKVNEGDEDGKTTVAAMDVLVPKVGELIGGSEREENYEKLRQRILEAGLPEEAYSWYLDLRVYGTVKHSGFGMGFERMIQFATGVDNIRDVIPFPRYPGRAEL